MKVTPSTIIALWSDGPAPPRRLSTPALGSRIRAPKVWSSLISRSVVRLKRVSPGFGLVRQMQWPRRARIEVEADQLRPGVMADRVHHPLALDDQRKVEIGDQQPLAFGERRD